MKNQEKETILIGVLTGLSVGDPVEIRVTNRHYYSHCKKGKYETVETGTYSGIITDITRQPKIKCNENTLLDGAYSFHDGIKHGTNNLALGIYVGKKD